MKWTRTKGLVTESVLITYDIVNESGNSIGSPYYGYRIQYAYYAIPFKEGDKLEDRYKIDKEKLLLSDAVTTPNKDVQEGHCVLGPGFYWAQVKKYASRVVDENQYGSFVDVYYNPDDESESVRYPGTTWGDYFNITTSIGGSIIGLGAYVFTVQLFKYLKSRKR